MSVDAHIARVDAERVRAEKMLRDRSAMLVGGAAGTERPRETSTDDFAEVRPLPPLLSPVEQFPLDLVPVPLRHWVAYHAEQLQCPPEFVAVPAMVAAGGCIGRQVAIRLRREASYIELPILWGACIGRPSTAKSPAQKPTVRILQRLESELRESWERDSAVRAREAELQRIVADEARKKARKFVGNGSKEEGRAVLEALSVTIEQEPEPRLIVNDSTVEKLAILLSQNQNGLVQVRDELTGWLSSLEHDGQNDRPFYLECWNGFTPYSVDRVTRQSVRVERPCLSIFGGIQPGRLEDYVRQAIRGGSGDDGLLQRFQLAVYPDLDHNWAFRDSAINPELEHSVLTNFRRLRAIDLADIEARHADWSDVPFIELDDAALAEYIGYVEPLMQRLRQGAEAPAMESHLGKYQSLVGRLALVIHLVEGRRGMVGRDSMLKALAWASYLEPHARRMYGIAIHPGLATAHRLLRRLGDLAEVFTERDVARRCWSGIESANTAEALEILVEHGHLCRLEPEQPSVGRPSVKYQRRSM